MSAKGNTLLLITLISLNGCQAIPQAGFLYAQKDLIGLEVGSGDASGSAFTAKLGASRTMGTYVPVAVLSKQGETVTPIGSTASDAVAQVLAQVKNEKEKQAFMTEFLAKARDGSLFDSISIFSSFDGYTAAETQKASLSVGNVFATGPAARFVAAAQLGLVCVRIQQIIEGAGNDASKKTLFESLRDSICNKK